MKYFIDISNILHRYVNNDAEWYRCGAWTSDIHDMCYHKSDSGYKEISEEDAFLYIMQNESEYQDEYAKYE